MVDHSKTVASIKGIENILKDIKAKQDSANSKIKEWAADTLYSPEHKEQKIAEIKGEFEQYAASRIDAMRAHADDIASVERALMQATVDLNDTAFANTLSIVNSMGAAMPHDQQRKIAEQFRGDYPAEKCLAAVYEKSKLAYIIELTNFEQFNGELRANIGFFASDSDKGVAGYRGIEKALNKMLFAINDDYRVDLGVSEAAFLAAVHAGAGLSVSSF